MRHRFDPLRDTGHSVPIGVAADHHRIYLLDEGCNPVPSGVTGEIFVAGERLADGYLDGVDESATRFTEDPFCPGQFMYRTGDLARSSATGLIEYLGRTDEQVKIGGVRVKPAEISLRWSRFPVSANLLWTW